MVRISRSSMVVSPVYRESSRGTTPRASRAQPGHQDPPSMRGSMAQRGLAWRWPGKGVPPVPIPIRPDHTHQGKGISLLRSRPYQRCSLGHRSINVHIAAAQGDALQM